MNQGNACLPRPIFCFYPPISHRHCIFVGLKRCPAASSAPRFLAPHLARWLVSQGVRHLMLCGRNSPSFTATEAMDDLRRAGAQVLFVQADVVRSEEVARLLAEMQSSMPPLRGVFHAAGTLDDGLLVQQDWPRFSTVMAPKVAGAWNLHRATRGVPLDCFVLFSSAASLLGASGQGNYAAANAFLDALAHHRGQQGLPGLSINWGPWADGGMSAARDGLGAAQWLARGIGTLTPQQGMEALVRLLPGSSAQVAVLPSAVARTRQPGVQTADQDNGGRRQKPDILAETDPAARLQLLIAYLGAQVAQSSAFREQAYVSLPLNNGLDSLMAELRNRVQVTATSLFRW